MNSMMKLLLFLLIILSLPAGAESDKPDAAAEFLVKSVRSSVTPWLVLPGKRSFLYRVHNRGAHPIRIHKKEDFDKGKDPILQVKPGETIDILLEGGSYLLDSPRQGSATGWYQLLNSYDPLPEPKKEESEEAEAS